MNNVTQEKETSNASIARRPFQKRFMKNLTCIDDQVIAPTDDSDSRITGAVIHRGCWKTPA
jgi:hypothetical protein